MEFQLLESNAGLGNVSNEKIKISFPLRTISLNTQQMTVSHSHTVEVNIVNDPHNRPGSSFTSFFLVFSMIATSPNLCLQFLEPYAAHICHPSLLEVYHSVSI